MPRREPVRLHRNQRPGINPPVSVRHIKLMPGSGVLNADKHVDPFQGKRKTPHKEAQVTGFVSRSAPNQRADTAGSQQCQGS